MKLFPYLSSATTCCVAGVVCFMFYTFTPTNRYDFGITAWSVLMIKVRGADGVTDVYTYLATRGEALGFLVACAPIGGFIEGMIGSKVGGALCILSKDDHTIRSRSTCGQHARTSNERTHEQADNTVCTYALNPPPKRATEIGIERKGRNARDSGGGGGG